MARIGDQICACGGRRVIAVGPNTYRWGKNEKAGEAPCLGDLLGVGAGAAHACRCDPISPEAGFDRAQYVFAGKVIQAENHAWLIEVERVWKGHERLARTVKLMDVYATLDCEFFFQPGQRYVFFAILAKGGREVFYHPQACNWTRPLQSTRVPAEGNEQLWLEDLITREHGPGEQPRAERS